MASGVVRAATSSTQRTTGCSADRLCGRPSTLAPTVATISPHLTLGHLRGQRAGPEVVRFVNVGGGQGFLSRVATFLGWPNCTRPAGHRATPSGPSQGPTPD